MPVSLRLWKWRKSAHKHNNCAGTTNFKFYLCLIPPLIRRELFPSFRDDHAEVGVGGIRGIDELVHGLGSLRLGDLHRPDVMPWPSASSTEMHTCPASYRSRLLVYSLECLRASLPWRPGGGSNLSPALVSREIDQQQTSHQTFTSLVASDDEIYLKVTSYNNSVLKHFLSSWSRFPYVLVLTQGQVCVMWFCYGITALKR